MVMASFSERFKTAGFVGLCLGIGAFLAVLVWPFVPAILWAIVLAILAEPTYSRLRKRMSPNLSSLAATGFTLAVIGLPLILVGTVLYVQISVFVREVASNAPPGENGLSIRYLAGELDKALAPVMDAIAPQFKLSSYVEEHRQDITRSLTQPAGLFAKNFAFTAVTLVIAFLTLFFMLRDGEKLKAPFLRLAPMDNDRAEAMLLRQVATVRGVFFGVVLVAIAQGALATAAYYIAGAPNVLMWGLLTTVLCTIPLLGAPIVYVPLSLILMAQGRMGSGLLLLALGFGVVSQIDNLLKPFVIGQRLMMHPMAVFFSLFGGVLALGPIGLFVGPMALAAGLSLLADIRERLEAPGAVT
jgi:predicted PurR-regulated permease PerM